MKLLALLVLLSLSSLSLAKDITVLEIDTGVGQDDYNGHGTHIAGIILNNTCAEVKLISCSYFDIFDTAQQTIQKSNACFKLALTLKPAIVNYSSGGPSPNKEEYNTIKALSDLGVIIVTSAGNDGMDLSENSHYDYYPADYNIKNLIPVGNLQSEYDRNPSSNYGLPNMVWEIGTDVYSDFLNGTHKRMTGTSQAAAKYTNRLLKEKCSEMNK